MKKNLVLLGMMGVGKSILGKIVAKQLNLKFIDIDLNIEKKCGMTISQIFNKKGEVFFRKEEQEEVLKSLKNHNSVIALGGGAFINKLIRDNILKKTTSIWLDLNLKALNKRVKWNKRRPLLEVKNTQVKINYLYDERKNIYKLAKHRINCNDKNKKNLAKEIINVYKKK